MRYIIRNKLILVMAVVFWGFLADAYGREYPVKRPARKTPPATEGSYTIRTDKPKQLIDGLGFEIQSDSIESGNAGISKNKSSVPHDLTPSERKRFAKEMLTGFRYCRLAGGLYFRGTDKEGKQLQERWPTQADELKEMLEMSGVESVAFEYWSPTPFWKDNRGYTKHHNKNGSKNILRCFGKDFANDPVYKGDVDAFLADFANAIVNDIKYLRKNGIPVKKFGLQNEPHANAGYSTCHYTHAEYVRAFVPVAKAIRAYDPSIIILADTWQGNHVRGVIANPETKDLVDHLVVHRIGFDSKTVKPLSKERAFRGLDLTKSDGTPYPFYQNEYEYLRGPTSPDRCMNTVQNIMNWFQIADSPIWYWIHALKPPKNSEASGYSLGFWKPPLKESKKAPLPRYNATRVAGGGHKFRKKVPKELLGLKYVTVTRGYDKKPGVPYTFSIDEKSTVYIAVENRGKPELGDGWEKTDMTLKHTFSDTVYRKVFEAGQVKIPPHNGVDKHGWFGIPHMAFVGKFEGQADKVVISDLPKKLKAKTGTFTKYEMSPELKALKPGHWTWNKYNWHAVVGFLKHMPWDSRSITVEEETFQDDNRIFAFKRPDGKLVIVLSNRCTADYTFNIKTGINGTFKGYRYRPENAGADFRGVPCGELKGPVISPTLADNTWEFWVQQ